MTRFHVHASAESAGDGNGDGDRVSCLLDVQANLLQHLNTCVVVPLLPLNQAPQPARVLNPVFEIDGQRYMMAAQFMAALPCRLLGREVLDLQAEAGTVVGALNCLFQGI